MTIMKGALLKRGAVLVWTAAILGLLCSLSAAGGGQESAGQVSVSLRLESGEFRAGEPIRGGVEVTLSGFESPQEVLLLASLESEPGKSQTTPYFAVTLTGRSNGVHRASLSGDLGCFADIESPGLHRIRVSATAGYKSGSVEASVNMLDDPSFSRRFRQPALDRRSKFVTEYPLNTPVQVHLGSQLWCRDETEVFSSDILQSARIVGAANLPLKRINHKIERGNHESDLASTWTLVFPKPGTYRLEFELAGEGFKPLKGHLNILVRGAGQVAHLRIWMDSERVALGKAFTLTATYETTELPETKDSKVSETMTITGPEVLKVEKVRTIPLAGTVEVVITYQVTLAKPGAYTWRMAAGTAGQDPPMDRTGSLTVTAPVLGGSAAWTRGQAALKESNNTALTGGSGTAQWRYRDAWGVEAVSVITWSAPPGSLSDGDEFDVELTASPWKPTGNEMPKGVPEFNASFFLTACLPVEGPGKRCSVNTRSGPLTSKVRHRFSSRLAGDKPVTILLAVNPAFKDITLSETWTYSRGGASPLAKGGLAELGEAKISQKSGPSGGPSAKQRGGGSSSAAKTAQDTLPELNAVLGAFRFGWKDGTPVISELIYPDIAESLGLKKGDPIAELNGRRTSEIPPGEIIRLLGKDGPRPLTIKIRRSDEVLVTIGVGK